MWHLSLLAAAGCLSRVIDPCPQSVLKLSGKSLKVPFTGVTRVISVPSCKQEVTVRLTGTRQSHFWWCMQQRSERSIE